MRVSKAVPAELFFAAHSQARQESCSLHASTAGMRCNTKHSSQLSEVIMTFVPSNVALSMHALSHVRNGSVESSHPTCHPRQGHTVMRCSRCSFSHRGCEIIHQAVQNCALRHEQCNLYPWFRLGQIRAETYLLDKPLDVEPCIAQEFEGLTEEEDFTVRSACRDCASYIAASLVGYAGYDCRLPLRR